MVQQKMLQLWINFVKHSNPTPNPGTLHRIVYESWYPYFIWQKWEVISKSIFNIFRNRSFGKELCLEAFSCRKTAVCSYWIGCRVPRLWRGYVITIRFLENAFGRFDRKNNIMIWLTSCVKWKCTYSRQCQLYTIYNVYKA